MSRNTEDEGRFGRQAQEEEKDEVEAHGRYGMTDEPKADDESDDDFEAHKHK